MKTLLLAAATSLAALTAVPTATAVGAGGTAVDVVFTGRVTDGDTGAPLSGVQVSVPELRAGALTDGTGEYTIRVSRRGLRSRRIRVEATLIGYGSRSRRVRVEGDTVRVDFRMEAEVLRLEELSVASDASRTGVGAPAHLAAFGPPPVDREAYAHIEENGFLAVRANPLSTFAIDVDRASYSNVRRFLRQGRLPPVDAVRVEELINYFPYDYREPTGEHPFSVTTEVGAAPWNTSHRLVRIGLQAVRVDTEDLPPSNLVFLLDVSGSMNSADKLPLLKSAFRLLVNELRPEDRVAIVVYAGAAGLVLPSTPGDRKDEILDAIERLEAGGSTAGGAGIRLAYDVARDNFVEGGNNRVILATDGDFNVGASSDSEMIRLIEEKREEGTFLTVLGFGTGNLQDSKMEGLADHGNGNYAYIDDLMEARKVLVTEIGGTLVTVAKDVKIQVEFNPAAVRAYRLLGYENRLLAAEDFDDDRKDAGEMGAGHSVTALYEVVPVGVESGVEIRGLDSLRYRTDAEVRPGAASSGELAYVKLRYKDPDHGASRRGARDASRLLDHPIRDRERDPSTDFRWASAVAAFGMVLRDSEFRGSATAADVLAWAREGVGGDPHGYRSEFIRLVETLVRSELLASRDP